MPSSGSLVWVHTGVKKSSFKEEKANSAMLFLFRVISEMTYLNLLYWDQKCSFDADVKSCSGLDLIKPFEKQKCKISAMSNLLNGKFEKESCHSFVWLFDYEVKLKVCSCLWAWHWGYLDVQFCQRSRLSHRPQVHDAELKHFLTSQFASICRWSNTLLCLEQSRIF